MSGELYLFSTAIITPFLHLMPIAVSPLLTALRACSICFNFPSEVKVVNEKSPIAQSLFWFFGFYLKGKIFSKLYKFEFLWTKKYRIGFWLGILPALKAEINFF
jgi:hypothetical protein